MNKDLSIYIHIPFCKSKCFYCDFCSSDKEDEVCIEKYIDAVIKEILNNAEILSEHSIKTIYFGGGTPSYINEKYIEKILEILNLFISDKPEEITIELNPADCTYDKLSSYVNMGINRFSLGTQSANDKTLKLIGRRHTKEDVINAINNMKKLGITNVSLDVITGLPSETIDTFRETLDFAVSFGDVVKHISTYSLEVHENTKLNTLIETGFVNLPSEDEERQMNDLTYNVLAENGYNMYEISNYSKEGYESKHNINYWNQGCYLGFGCAASSYINSKRYTNISNIDEYILRVNNSEDLVEYSEELDKLDTIKEYIILKLRLNKGLDTNEFYSKFKTSIFDMYKSEIDELITNKLMEHKKNIIYLTPYGRDVANIVWEKFI